MVVPLAIDSVEETGEESATLGILGTLGVVTFLSATTSDLEVVASVVAQDGGLAAIGAGEDGVGDVERDTADVGWSVDTVAAVFVTDAEKRMASFSLVSLLTTTGL